MKKKMGPLTRQLIRNQQLSRLSVDDGTQVRLKTNSPVHPAIHYIRDRILNKNQNWMGVVVGDTGTGKSYSVLKMAKCVDPTFEIDTRVAFSVKSFMEMITSGHLRKGNAIIFDEAGVGMSQRDWYTDVNKAVVKVMQVYRTDNLAVFFTVPNFKWIDSGVRGLIQNLIRTGGVNRSENLCRMRFYKISTNPFNGDIMYKFLKVKSGGRSFIMRDVYVKKPNIISVRRYEELRRIMVGEVKTRTIQKINQVEKPIEEKKRIKKRDIIIQEYRSGITNSWEIARRTGFSSDYVYSVVRTAKELHQKPADSAAVPLAK